MRRRGVLAALAVLPLAGFGCVAVAAVTGAVAGAGAIVWHQGWLRTSIGEPIERVHRASKAGLGDLRATVERNELAASAGVVEGTLADGRRVAIRTRLLAEKETAVRIRVGFWGDQSTSLRILMQMKKHL